MLDRRHNISRFGMEKYPKGRTLIHFFFQPPEMGEESDSWYRRLIPEPGSIEEDKMTKQLFEKLVVESTETMDRVSTKKQKRKD